jgi:predicted esterase
MERFELFRQRVISTGLRAGPDAALGVLDRDEGRYPEQVRTLRWWRLSLVAESGRRDDFLTLLRRALDDDDWWSEKLLRRSDFNAFAGDPDFEALVAECDRRREAAETGPGLLVAEPVEETSAGAPPLLVALHGSGPSARATLEPWRPATEDGWLVAAPVSSQLAAPNAPSWWEFERARDEIAAHLKTLAGSYDADRIVIAGFSRGGAIAAEAAIRDDLGAAGLIAVGPGPFELDDVARLIEGARDRGLKAFILVGDRDAYCLDSANDLAAALAVGGVPCELELREGLGHEFPADFGDVLRRSLRLLGN